MSSLIKTVFCAIAVVTLAGCYTGEMPLSKRFIQDADISSFNEDGRTFLRVRGVSGMPMGVCRSERYVDGNVMYLNLVISENQKGDLRIDEQFVIPDRVKKVQMGEDIIWDRDGSRSRKKAWF